MRTVARTDSNHQQIVEELRQVGAVVQSLHQVGGGVPDLLVAYRGRNWLFEVKTPTGTLTPDEAAWHREWAVRGQVAIVRTAEQAIEVITG